MEVGDGGPVLEVSIKGGSTILWRFLDLRPTSPPSMLGYPASPICVTMATRSNSAVLAHLFYVHHQSAAVGLFLCDY